MSLYKLHKVEDLKNTAILFSEEMLIAMRSASLLAHRMAISFNNNGEFDGIYVEVYINGILRLIKVDENFDMTVNEMYSNPLKTSNQ